MFLYISSKHLWRHWGHHVMSEAQDISCAEQHTRHSTSPAQPGMTVAAQLLPSARQTSQCMVLSHLLLYPSTAAAVFLRDLKWIYVSKIFMCHPSSTDTTASPSQHCNQPLYPPEIIPIPLGYSAGWETLIHCNLQVIPWLPACLSRNPCPANPSLAPGLQDAGLDVWPYLKTNTGYLCQATKPKCSTTVTYCLILHLSSGLLSFMNIPLSPQNHWQTCYIVKEQDLSPTRAGQKHAPLLPCLLPCCDACKSTGLKFTQDVLY